MFRVACFFSCVLGWTNIYSKIYHLNYHLFNWVNSQLFFSTMMYMLNYAVINVMKFLFQKLFWYFVLIWNYDRVDDGVVDWIFENYFWILEMIIKAVVDRGAFMEGFWGSKKILGKNFLFHTKKLKPLPRKISGYAPGGGFSKICPKVGSFWYPKRMTTEVLTVIF